MNNQNELNQKQVFTEGPAASAQPALVENYDNLPEPAFDKKAVLDEAYAEQKAKREGGFHLPVKLPDVKLPQITPPKPQPRRKSSAGPQRMRTVRFADIRLVSGERAADAARRIVREFGALVLFCVLVAAVFWVKGFILNRMTNDDYSSLARSTTYSSAVTAGGINWAGTELPDGLAAAQTVCTQLESPITDSTFTNKSGSTLLYPTVVSAGMASALTAERVQLKTDMSNLDLLLQIYMSLDAGKPVIVLFYDTQTDAVRYGIVTYMDAETDVITVQTADGEARTLTLEQFIAATRFENTEELPFKVRTGLMFGSWSRNTAIFVQ